jgi:hypothetical protein
MRRKRLIWVGIILLAFIGAFAIMPSNILRSLTVSSQSDYDIYEIVSYASYQFNVLKSPSGLLLLPNASGPAGRFSLFISDSGNHVTREFKSETGTMTIIAGTLGEAGYLDGSPGKLNYPTGMSGTSLAWTPCDAQFRGDASRPTEPLNPQCVVHNYKVVNINDSQNYMIRRVCVGVLPIQPDPDCPNNELQTVSGSLKKGYTDGLSKSASFGSLAGIDKLGGVNYVADAENHVVRTWDGASVATFAGDGTPGYLNGYRTNAKFCLPAKVTQDNNGNIYVADICNNAIRKIDTNGYVSTFAGGGPAAPEFLDANGESARLYRPTSIVYNPADGNLYVADSNNNCIRRIDPQGNTTTYTGNKEGGYVNGNLSQARFNTPTDLVIYSGIMYISDSLNNCIRRIDMATGAVTTYIN